MIYKSGCHYVPVLGLAWKQDGTIGYFVFKVILFGLSTAKTLHHIIVMIIESRTIIIIVNQIESIN